MTGQTGSRQARLTLGGSNRRCPRDWNADPAERFASGSAHQATVPVQQGRLQRSSLFLVHALQRRLLLHQLRIRTEAFDDEYKYVLTELGSPFKGLGAARSKVFFSVAVRAKGNCVCDRILAARG